MSNETFSENDHPAPKAAEFWSAFRFWLKLGFISFGGPAGQIAIMHQELVEKRRWISEKRFLHALNFCMVLPGPEAQQLATYIGWLLHRTRGGLVAGILFFLPSFFILIGLSWGYIAFGEVPIVAGLLYGIKPAVTAIVLHAAWRIGGRALTNWYMGAISMAAFIAIFAFKIPFPVIVLCALAIGAIGGRIAPKVFNTSKSHESTQRKYGPALIDDNTPTPDHAKFSWRRFASLVVIGFTLWALPMAVLNVTLGWNHTLTQMGWFFTKAAFLTFGGAYAVLPYVYQGAVLHYGWLSGPQMIDGLGLGETTPGPLIMVVVFVGFLGGYVKTVCGPDLLFWGGAVAAVLVTWFTFLPSIFLILVGGPLVESTHNNLRFTAPLTAITAAVVGVILNLTLFFGYHVFWPNGFSGTFDGLAAMLAGFAAVSLFRFKVPMIVVIAACAITGVGLKALLAI